MAVPSFDTMSPRSALRFRTPLAGLALALLFVSASACRTAAPRAKASPEPPERTAVLLAVNDIYRIEGLDGGAIGGFGRLRALRASLEAKHPDLVMLHGGDFLFPSFASRTYSGAQMVAAMNALDGRPATFDPRLLVTFGNHEFERPKLEESGILQKRLDESEFRWLGANVVFGQSPEGKPFIASKNLSRGVVMESGGIRLGIFGLTLALKDVKYVARFQDAAETAREMTKDLRSQGAEAVVALTHLSASEDEALLKALGDQGPDLIIGGHEHERLARPVLGRYILKADSDARSATVVTLTKKADGRLVVAHRMQDLDASITPDPAMESLVSDWQTRHASDFCKSRNAPANCLDEVYGKTRTLLEAEENKIRGRETSLGNFIADRMLAAYRSCGAQVAFVNAGSLRVNRDVAPGPISRRVIEELFAYKNPLRLLRIDGATLAKVATRSAERWSGHGSWLQIAGFAFRHDTNASRASDLTLLLGPGSSRLIAPDETILAVTSDYLVDPNFDQDGYDMLSRAQIDPACSVVVDDLRDVIVEDLRRAGEEGIAPVREGRICQGAAGAPCLIPTR